MGTTTPIRFVIAFAWAFAGLGGLSSNPTRADDSVTSAKVAEPLLPAISADLPEEEEPVQVEPPFDPAGPAPKRTESLDLSSVLDSIATVYPLLEIAILERIVRDGEMIAARGKFDTQLRADSISQPLGFYRTYRNSVGASQPLWNGGQFDLGYRKGDGNFEPWYGGRETDEGGEFGAMLLLPWLQNRQIDARRADLFRANIDRQLVEPDIQSAFIDFTREGTVAYWNWVAAGQIVIVNRRLVELAVSRRSFLQVEFERGRISELATQDNDRLVLSRKGKLLQVQQKLQAAAIKLSLFIRDSEGRPIVARYEQLPEAFPGIADRRDEPVQRDIEMALMRRPELRRLDYERRKLNVDLAEARNVFRPKVDSYLAVRDDVGTPASSKGDKSELELEAGLMMSMPVQRRAGRGKMQAVQGKFAQWNQKASFARDKITIDVQTAVNDLSLTYDRVQLAREASRLAEKLAAAERERVARGKADLFELNFREETAANTIVTEIEALFEYFTAEANLRYATAAELERLAGLSLWDR